MATADPGNYSAYHDLAGLADARSVVGARVEIALVDALAAPVLVVVRTAAFAPVAGEPADGVNEQLSHAAGPA